MGRENIKIVKHLQERVLQKKTNPTKDELAAVGIDINVHPQEFRNIVLRKGFLGDWSISLINEHHDLDGHPIAENPKLKQILKTYYQNGKKEIKTQELHNLNIYTAKSEYKVGNVRLMSFFGAAFDIDLIDKLKDPDGLWLDEAITEDRILEVLNQFSISKKALTQYKEVELNKKLEAHFKQFFAVVKMGGTSNKGLIDLVLGDNKFGIELKLGRELKKSDQADRARGQIDRYKEEFKSRFMMVVAGTEEEEHEKSVQDLFKKLKETNTLKYYLRPDKKLN